MTPEQDATEQKATKKATKKVTKKVTRKIPTVLIKTVYPIDLGSDRPIRLDDSFTSSQRIKASIGVAPAGIHLELDEGEATQLAKIGAVKIVNKSLQDDIEDEVKEQKEKDIPSTDMKHYLDEKEN